MLNENTAIFSEVTPEKLSYIDFIRTSYIESLTLESLLNWNEVLKLRKN
jgi:hypothetical protein